MNIYDQTDSEIALLLAQKIKAWRISPRGAALSREALAKKSQVGITPLKRFENTGATTLRNLIAVMRSLELLEGLETLIPDPDTPSPLELLEQDRGKPARKRAPRKRKGE